MAAAGGGHRRQNSAGEDVTLVEVNTARARLLSGDGLLISRAGEEEVCVPLRVVSSVEGLAPFDLVFVAVKTYETEEAVRAVLSACSPATLFLTLTWRNARKRLE